MDLLKIINKITFLLLLITNICHSYKIKNDEKINLPCRHVNPNKS